MIRTSHSSGFRLCVFCVNNRKAHCPLRLYGGPENLQRRIVSKCFYKSYGFYGLKYKIKQGDPGVYHVISRTALSGLPFKAVEKDMLLSIIKRFSQLFFVEVLGFSLMGNHFHLVVRMLPENRFTDEELMERLQRHYGENFHLVESRIPYYIEKLTSLANFMKEVKQALSVYYNQCHKRKGTLWGERFKSVSVENGETLVNRLAYVELNPVRASLVKKPKDYRWNSMGYHAQTNNADDFLSTDFGVLEFGEKDAVERFLSRTRYFTHSGVNGSKAFVSDTFLRFQELFQNPGKRTPKPVQGLNEVYSLKRLSKTI